MRKNELVYNRLIIMTFWYSFICILHTTIIRTARCIAIGICTKCVRHPLPFTFSVQCCTPHTRSAERRHPPLTKQGVRRSPVTSRCTSRRLTAPTITLSNNNVSPRIIVKYFYLRVASLSISISCTL